jgi:hypothetical protein
MLSEQNTNIFSIASDIALDIIGDGGGTYSLNGEQVPTDGYIASRMGAQVIIPLSEFNPMDIIRYVSEQVVSLSMGSFLGAWIDDDKVYLDVSTHFHYPEHAIRYGFANNQIAVWDVAGKREIRLQEIDPEYKPQQ